jgi:hypothetical protein
MALCFTNHDGDLKELLRPFDEAYEARNGVKGGKLKRGSLRDRDIPEQVKFKNRPHLDDLINDLTETFAVRYEPLPSNKKPALFENYMSDRKTRMDNGLPAESQLVG